ncbi:unnamed protein product [Pedinophyceae sp. YPF-701]|nr:unnamed protein product [Pedinophyceae sp. YPF-701]
MTSSLNQQGAQEEAPGDVTFRAGAPQLVRAQAAGAPSSPRTPLAASAPKIELSPNPSVGPSPLGSPTGPAAAEDRIQVCIRARPPNGREREIGFRNCLQIGQSGTDIVLQPSGAAPPHPFAFDHVLGAETGQDRMFRVAGRPVVENSLIGYNSCIFAYGQTGSGKTYTMLGPASEGEDFFQDTPLSPHQHPDRGLTPRVFEHLFQRIKAKERSEGRRFSVTCSYVEIYNEGLTDLLAPGAAPLQIREDFTRGVRVEGLSEETVRNAHDVARLITQGSANRRVGSTEMNKESSRSHTVFICYLESSHTTPDGVTHRLSSRLNLVDLAGSERQKDTHARDERLREACSINKSLSALGHVIMTLAEVAKGKVRHIPYRGSRLTFLLQDSLGGNSRTVMIACVSPASCNLGETLSTLRFAASAKCVRTRAVVNEDAAGDARALRAEVARLRQQMAEYKDLLARRGLSGSPLPAATPAPGRALTPATATPASPSVRDRALLHALRREAEARSAAERVAAEREELRALVAARTSELQHTRMALKLREASLQRRGDASTDERVRVLQDELASLRKVLQVPPEAVALNVELQGLRARLAEIEAFSEPGARERLQEEIATLSDRARTALEDKEALARQLHRFRHLSTPFRSAGKAATPPRSEGRASDGAGDMDVDGDGASEAAPEDAGEAARRGEALQVEVDALRAELGEKSAALAQAMVEQFRDQAVAEESERRACELHDAFERATAELVQARQALAEARGEVVTLKARLGSVEASDAEAQETARSQATRLQRLAAELDQARGGVVAAREDAASERRRAEGLESSLREALADVDAARAAGEEARGQAQGLEEELLAAQEAVRDLERECADAAERVAASEVREGALRAELEEAARRATHVEERLRDASEVLERERVEAARRAAGVEERLRDATAALERERAEAARREADAAEAERRAEGVEERLRGAMAELERERAEAARREADAAEAERMDRCSGGGREALRAALEDERAKHTAEQRGMEHVLRAEKRAREAAEEAAAAAKAELAAAKAELAAAREAFEAMPRWTPRETIIVTPAKGARAPPPRTPSRGRATPARAGSPRASVEELRARAAELEGELVEVRRERDGAVAEAARLAGHHNPRQRIHVHERVCEENSRLKEEVRRLRAALDGRGGTPPAVRGGAPSASAHGSASEDSEGATEAGGAGEESAPVSARPGGVVKVETPLSSHRITTPVASRCVTPDASAPTSPRPLAELGGPEVAMLEGTTS